MVFSEIGQAEIGINQKVLIKLRSAGEIQNDPTICHALRTIERSPASSHTYVANFKLNYQQL